VSFEESQRLRGHNRALRAKHEHESEQLRLALYASRSLRVEVSARARSLLRSFVAVMGAA
jgi:hypothetical protein